MYIQSFFVPGLADIFLTLHRGERDLRHVIRLARHWKGSTFTVHKGNGNAAKSPISLRLIFIADFPGLRVTSIWPQGQVRKSSFSKQASVISHLPVKEGDEFQIEA